MIRRSRTFKIEKLGGDSPGHSKVNVIDGGIVGFSQAFDLNLIQEDKMMEESSSSSNNFDTYIIGEKESFSKPEPKKSPRVSVFFSQKGVLTPVEDKEEHSNSRNDTS